MSYEIRVANRLGSLQQSSSPPAAGAEIAAYHYGELGGNTLCLSSLWRLCGDQWEWSYRSVLEKQSKLDLYDTVLKHKTPGMDISIFQTFLMSFNPQNVILLSILIALQLSGDDGIHTEKNMIHVLLISNKFNVKEVFLRWKCINKINEAQTFIICQCSLRCRIVWAHQQMIHCCPYMM